MNTDNTASKLDRTFTTAPMMDWSDRHCRFFWRKLTRHAVLYTEMVTTGAIIFGNRERYLEYNDGEQPIALQLGGSDPAALARCAIYAEQWQYNEINLNVGCPSDRVQNNMIGACLMAHPQLVADCVKAMRDACSIPVTVKHRIGIDDQDSYEQMRDFVGTVADAGCEVFIVHARKAILQGLSPKENREIPPLKYEYVYRLKQEFPQLEILINGGINSHEQAHECLQHVDGVMIGREAYQSPSILLDVDRLYYGQTAENPERNKAAIIRSLYPYIEEQCSRGAPLHHISRHTLGFFHGQNGARLYRRHLSENAHRRNAGPEIIEQALQLMGY